jgi:hypothetical protein
MNARRNAGIHEDFSREEELRPSSNRAFGLVFSAFFLFLGLAPLLRGRAGRPWAVVVAAAFFGISLVAPKLLQPLNALWIKLGKILQKVTNPAVMALLFFSTLAPIGFLMRLMKRDPLHLRWDRDASSYWINRAPPGPEPQSMRDQF